MFSLVCSDRGEPCPYGLYEIFQYHISRKSSYINNNLTAAASRRPTVLGIIFHSVQSTNFCGLRTGAFQPPLCKWCGSPVETSAFNAEAPTEPAGETVGCRRQLGGIVRLILYDFIKIPTVRRCLLHIVRNSLWLSLTHCAIPPFPQKSRSARLFGCKRPHYGSLSLPTFADCGQPQGLSYSALLTPQRFYHRFIGQACFLNAARNST